ncbi:MAG TPA: sigma-70 family RNA polymerase sigma factor [Solirubrobacterales bacterium]|nr:sigma-70 family RNA polymerase sigma factor [Solirubrobacterales bacterium]
MSQSAVLSLFQAGGSANRLLSDDRLARQAAGGDQRAFDAIYRRYHQNLYRFCLAIVGDPQDAQDALQSTMVKVLRALPGEERKIELKPWLYRIAHNESIELLRRRRSTEQIDPEQVAQGSGLAEEVAQRERLRQLISDLDELPERQRGALVMRELAGLSFAEIGTALDTSSSVARQTLYEARLSLQQMDAGREMSCATVTRALSDADGRVTRRRDIRSHLRTCSSCRCFGEELDARQHDFAAMAPLPALAAAGLLRGVLGGHGGSGGGLAGTLGGGAGKALGASALVKSAAAVAIVAALGISAADRGGLIHVPGLGGDGGPQAARTQLQAHAVQSEGQSAASAKGRAAAAARLEATHPALAAAKGLTVLRRVGKTNVGNSTSSPSHGASAAHPHGRGHPKEHPAAAGRGQRKAATHKSSGHSPSHPTHPTKPSHPVRPSNAGANKTPRLPPPSQGSGHEVPPRTSPTRHSADPEATPPLESGKQP